MIEGKPRLGQGEAERLATAMAAARGQGGSSPPPSFGFSLSMIQPMSAGCTYSVGRTLSLGADSVMRWGPAPGDGAADAAAGDVAAAGAPAPVCMGAGAAAACREAACVIDCGKPSAWPDACGAGAVEAPAGMLDERQAQRCSGGECSSGQDEGTPRIQQQEQQQKQQKQRQQHSGSPQDQPEGTNPSGSLTAFAAAGLLSNDALSRLRQGGRTAGAFCPPPPPPQQQQQQQPGGKPPDRAACALGPAPPGPGPPRAAAAAGRRMRRGPDATRAALGDRPFYLMRAAMIAQRDQFQAQLFDLHRVVRAQRQLAAELGAGHAAGTARYAAEAAALLSNGLRGARAAAPAGGATAAAPAPSCGAKRRHRDAQGGENCEGKGQVEQQQRAAAERGPSPPGGPRPVGSDDRGARAVASLPLHVSLMLNLPSRVRQSVASSAGAAGAAPAAPAAVTAAAADHFWAPRKNVGVRRPVASRYPSCAPGGGCLPALSGDTTVAQPRPGATTNPQRRPAAAANGGGGAVMSAPAAFFAATSPPSLASPLLAAGAAARQRGLGASPGCSHQAPSSVGRGARAPSASAGGGAPSGSGGSGAVIKPRALPASARPPVQLPAPVGGPKPLIKSGSRSSGRAPSQTCTSSGAAGPASNAWQDPLHSTVGVGGVPAWPPLRPAPGVAAPAASAPAGARGAAPRSVGPVPPPFASLQLPALSGQPSGSHSVPSINPFRPAPQLQPLAASQLMAGGVSSGPPGGAPFGPPPHLVAFDPHTYWVRKHFGGGPAAAAAAAAAAPPSPPQPSVQHWWHDPRAVFGDGPGLIDPNAACDAPPPMLAPFAATGPLGGAAGAPKRPRAGSADSGDSGFRGSGRIVGAGGMPLGSMPPPGGGGGGGGGNAARRGGARGGLAFRAVERRAPPAKRAAGSRVWSSLPSRAESADS